MIQDIYPHQFHNEYRSRAVPKIDSPVLCFRGQSVLAKQTETKGVCRLEFPVSGKLFSRSLSTSTGSLVYAFAVDETEYFLYLQEDVNLEDDPGFEYLDLRRIRRHLSNLFGMVVFTGYHLYRWYSTSRYCGACGQKAVHDSRERAMYCPVCKIKEYPRLMPAVIVGVINDNRLLLTRYREGVSFYALIAGFTEIGETLEETVAREVLEETGLYVKNIRYYKSQPWGIAGDILAGFYCDVDGEDMITPDNSELKSAEWKCREEIELQPDNYSLTNEMMRRFKEGKEC